MAFLSHEEYMTQALALAREAAERGDVPVGCVIVDEMGTVIGFGRNRREECHDAAAHAEVEAIRMACKTVGSWRLHKARLYVTLEPCPMCAGAILNARIAEVHYGMREENTGACGSVLNLFEEPFGHRPRLYRGPLEEECAALLRDFFLSRRQNKGEEKKI